MVCQNNLNDSLHLSATSRQALQDLSMIWPDLSIEELANHAIQLTWGRNFDRIEAARAGTINQVVGA